MFTVHLWVAMQAKEILTPLEQVGESIPKFCSSSKPHATNLAFGTVLSPISFWLITQRRDIYGWPLSFSSIWTSLSFHRFNWFYLAFCTSALLWVSNASLISYSSVSALTFSDMFWLGVSISFSFVGKVSHLWTDAKSILTFSPFWSVMFQWWRYFPVALPPGDTTAAVFHGSSLLILYCTSVLGFIWLRFCFLEIFGQIVFQMVLAGRLFQS